LRYGKSHNFNAAAKIRITTTQIQPIGRSLISINQSRFVIGNPGAFFLYGRLFIANNPTGTIVGHFYRHNDILYLFEKATIATVCINVL